jgi:DNA-directed RNA polymerase subunit RPC12/RpoP
MSDGKHCPACGKDIGVLAVLLAGMPTRIRCPHCKARLTYGSSVLLVLGVMTLVALATVASCYAVSRYFGARYSFTDPVKFYGVAIGLVLGLWIPIELAFTVYMRRRGVLRKHQ